MLEPLLLFETVLIENRSIVELLDPSFTYQSDWLNHWSENYLAPELKTHAKTPKFTRRTVVFKRLPVRDRRTGGIITNAAVMTMTSGPDETHPITRGVWMAGVIFNNPPPPPPDDVPPLPVEISENEKSLTLRERLAAHRDRADCAGCHEKIDPLGFALENFNAVGLWRDQYENGRDIDMQGNLFRKQDFADIYEFKDAILNEKDRFARGLAEHLLSFGLARALDANDMPSIDKITTNIIAKEYRLRELIKEVVLSESFLMKSNSKTLSTTNTSPSS